MIKELLENQEYMIILDTNVLLHIYQYSPDYSQFAVDCLKAISDHVFVPSMVYLEYSKHCRSEFSKIARKVLSAKEQPTKRLQEVSESMVKACNFLEQLQYPDVELLKSTLTEKFNDISIFLDDFFSDREGWQLAASSWGNTDLVANLVEKWKSNNQINNPFSQEELYKICDEGLERYKKLTPPGFKDSKNKDGIRKYGDLIIWKEVLNFSKENSKNVVFVTDDIKADWWTKNDTGETVFHDKLVDEYHRVTSCELVAFSSIDFYDDISSDYGVTKPQMLELALHANIDKLAEKNADDVFSKIEESLIYSNTEWIEDSDVGTEGIDEFEIENYEFIKAIESPNYIGEYIFTFQVTLSGTSYDYWGRDDDTKEIILSPGRIHTFEGQVDVRVSREVDDIMDFDTFIIEEASIISGQLTQTSVDDLSFGDEFDDYSEVQVCLDCGCPLTEEDGSSGYCRDCATNH